MVLDIQIVKSVPYPVEAPQQPSSRPTPTPDTTSGCEQDTPAAKAATPEAATTEAAVQTEGSWRDDLDDGAAKQKREEEEDESAVAIQKVVRGKQSRKKTNTRQEAAVKLQKFARGRSVRSRPTFHKCKPRSKNWVLNTAL